MKTKGIEAGVNDSATITMARQRLHLAFRCRPKTIAEAIVEVNNVYPGTAEEMYWVQFRRLLCDHEIASSGERICTITGDVSMTWEAT